jgi:hypothetical protein
LLGQEVVVTESEWVACSKLEPMLMFLHERVSDRKFRLFACACCRRVWDALGDETNRAAVEVTERFCDGSASDEERRAASDRAWALYEKRSEGSGYGTPAASAAFAAASASAHAMPWLVGYDFKTAAHMAAEGAAKLAPSFDAERAVQVVLLRDIVGPLPFRPVALAPDWLTSDVRTLARGIHDERAFDRLPILADALQDAGCNSADLLDHCRDINQVHARGCWVVDLVLERE